MNYFTFDGVDSRCFNTYIATSNAFDAPSQDVEVITVPGNNNIYYIDNDSYKPFDMVLYCYVPSDMQNKVDDLRNFLAHKGICKYVEAIKPDEFRYARFINAFEIDVSDRVSAAFKLVFKAQPQRYKTRNTPITFASNSTTTTGTEMNLSTIPAPLRISLTGNSDNSATVTGDNTITLIGKNLLSTDTYKTGNYLYIGNTSTGYDIHLPAGTYTITKSSKISVGTYYRERNDNSNTQIISGHTGTKSATFVLAGGDYRFYFYKSDGVSKSDINYWQLEAGSVATPYQEYEKKDYLLELGDIALTDSDSIIKTNNKWYIHNLTDTEITDADLVAELNALEAAKSFSGGTTIIQDADSNPFNLSVKSLDGIDVPSAYNTEPIIQVNAPGVFIVNGNEYEVLSAPVTINTQTMQCYDGNTNMNNQVIMRDFPILEKGNNEVASEVALSITPNYWEL